MRWNRCSGGGLCLFLLMLAGKILLDIDFVEINSFYIFALLKKQENSYVNH
jgi:hypothetical protein